MAEARCGSRGGCRLSFCRLPLLAQQPAPVDRSLRLFVVMAAINAAGYDAGLNSPHASPVRRLVREEVAAAQPASLEALRAFYAAHRHPDSCAP